MVASSAPAATAVPGGPAVQGPAEARSDLLVQVLRPYRSHTSYLQEASIGLLEDAAVGGEARLRAEGRFSIPSSCYIDDTGHFNAVELNICYNQLLYYLLAAAVEQRSIPELAHWTLEDFWRHQLPDVLITDLHSWFRRPMSGKAFDGELIVDSIADWRGADYRGPVLILNTTTRFWDRHGGTCGATVRIAITHHDTTPDSPDEEQPDATDRS